MFSEIKDKLSLIHENTVLYNDKVFYTDIIDLDTHESILYGYDLSSKQIMFSAHTKGNDIYTYNDKVYILDAMIKLRLLNSSRVMLISHQKPLRIIPVRIEKRRSRLRERPDARRCDVDIGVWRCGGRDERHLGCGGEP